MLSHLMDNRSDLIIFFMTDNASAENVYQRRSTVTVNLRQRFAPPGLSPAPPSQTLLVEKERSPLPYKTADILLGFKKKKQL